MKLRAQHLNLWLLLIVCSSLLVSCADIATDDRKSVTLALKKDGKTYLFSRIGTFITQNKLDQNESPKITKSIKIIEKDDKIYIEPQYVKNMVNIISGNYVIHDSQEKTFDGYVTEGKHKVYDKQYNDEHTDKIGKITSIANIYLTDIGQTKKHHISWQRSPELSPIKNCIELAIWVDKSYKPGERTVAKDNFILISLNDLAEFYDSGITLDYVEKDDILYIIAN